MGGHAFVGLHARTVLLISREALGLFDADEMVAIMAHELGHDYVSDEYAKAREEHDDERLQELELRCDVVAVITLRKMHVDPARLISAATKLLRHNERIRTLDYASHVPLDQRVRFIIAVARLTANSRQHVTGRLVGMRGSSRQDVICGELLRREPSRRSSVAAQSWTRRPKNYRTLPCRRLASPVAIVAPTIPTNRQQSA